MILTRILTTLPDTTSTQALGKALVTARLVACAHVSAPGTSFYIWEGQEEHSPEVQLWLKTTPDRAAEALAELARRHPYDCPMILTDTVEANPAYAAWVAEQVA